MSGPLTDLVASPDLPDEVVEIRRNLVADLARGGYAVVHVPSIGRGVDMAPLDADEEWAQGWDHFRDQVALVLDAQRNGGI